MLNSESHDLCDHIWSVKYPDGLRSLEQTELLPEFLFKILKKNSFANWEIFGLKKKELQWTRSQSIHDPDVFGFYGLYLMSMSKINDVCSFVVKTPLQINKIVS